MSLLLHLCHVSTSICSSVMLLVVLIGTVSNPPIFIVLGLMFPLRA